MYFVIDVIAPVFVIVLIGYLAVKLKAFPSGGISALIAFTNNFAAPWHWRNMHGLKNSDSIVRQIQECR